jgi:endonuclease YncB( thermonuclease family)
MVFADTLTGKFVKITDSDMLQSQVATTRHKICLAGIDAPGRDQPYSAESAENLSRLVAGERVTVEWTKKA